jgi:hypothetical protein
MGSARGAISESRRPLNGVDRFLMAVDRTIRKLGGPGFETQTFVWLDGRIDARRLSADVALLSQCYPVLTARLVERGGPYWRLWPGSAAMLHERLLQSDDEQAVLDEAANLLSTPTDPAENDPVRFHLLHRPNGCDVLLIQYNHALLDHNDAILLLRQLDDTASSANRLTSPLQTPWHDPTWEYLRRTPRSRRRAAALAAERWRHSLRGLAVRLPEQDSYLGPLSYRLVTRRLEQTEAAALRAQMVRCCGVPGLSMGVLACAFRAVDRLAGGRPGRFLNAGIGVDLGLSRSGMPAMQNLTTLVPLRVDREDLEDRNALIRILNKQLREHLTNDMDLGVLELATIFGRRQHQARWAIELLLRYSLSLWYGSFGVIRGLRDSFCDVPLKQVFSAGPVWPPMGLTLLVNEFAGRLHLQTTYMPEVVPESLANRFIDHVIEDLPR